jgi:hypothetical protein
MLVIKIKNHVIVNSLKNIISNLVYLIDKLFFFE